MNGATKKGDCNSDRQGRISGPAETDAMSVGSRGGSGEIPRRYERRHKKRRLQKRLRRPHQRPGGDGRNVRREPRGFGGNPP